MFLCDRILDNATRRALYAYCPFEELVPEPAPIEDVGMDVGCLVDNLLNSHKRTHIHPDDLYVDFVVLVTRC